MKRLIYIILILCLATIPTVNADAFTSFEAYGDAWKSTNDTYTVIKWNATGSHTWIATGNTSSAEFLIIAGGGAGGRESTLYWGNGGGGAGGLISGTNNSLSGTIPITVGAGGTVGGNPSDGGNGGNSVFSNNTAIGGGGGAYSYGGTPRTGKSGGSGGGGPSGGSDGSAGGAGGSGTTGQGYAGATGNNPKYSGGGGGGAGGVGSSHSGGWGVNNSITGTVVCYAGGGGGGGYTGSSGNSFLCGGGNGSSMGGAPGAGVNGLGGGGGGMYRSSSTTGSGGSGVVIIRYKHVLSAKFTASNISGAAPLLVNFTDTSSSALGIDTRNWSFNEVEGNNTEIVFATTQNPNYLFPVGNFLIRLNVTSGSSYNISTQNTWINVTSEVVPVAMFTKSRTVVIFPGAIQFNDTSTNIPTSWNWSFGDGTFSEVQNASHRYTKRGRWTILMNATNGAGSSTNTSMVWILGG